MGPGRPGPGRGAAASQEHGPGAQAVLPMGSSAARFLRAPQSWGTPSLPLWSLSQLPRRSWSVREVARCPLVRMGRVYPERLQPGSHKDCGLGMHRTQQFPQSTARQMRYQLLALTFQAGVGLWGPGHPESGPRYARLLQPAGWGREDTVLPPSPGPRPADLFNLNSSLASLGPSMASVQGPQGSALSGALDGSPCGREIAQSLCWDSLQEFRATTCL